MFARIVKKGEGVIFRCPYTDTVAAPEFVAYSVSSFDEKYVDPGVETFQVPYDKPMILQNYNLLKTGSKPWRGGHEKVKYVVFIDDNMRVLCVEEDAVHMQTLADG